ncbi:hypothetical protein [Flavobacterium agrisoli]|uniref:Uncharacterized protein n=1 Tax=Flavobacterium agrisoli TaxID=2793066 RepID=A0A934UL27_9FLAO|nr:hypothetical protein [Flavobacterium agrisoli]MBK0371055.1 hypothetical protein [Flavobacterium agrisoli]
MKKKLEADLISIAHRILKLKNKSDINQLYLETQKLYEKLSVLKFVEDHFEGAKPTIGRSEIESQLETAFESAPIALEVPVTTEEPIILEEITATAAEISIEETPAIRIEEETIEAVEITENTEVIAEKPVDYPVFKEEEKKAIEMVTETHFSEFEPAFELEEEEEEIEEPQLITKPQAVQISFEDLMGISYKEAQFVKVEDVEKTPVAPPKAVQEQKTEPEIAVLEPKEIKPMSLNERLSKGIQIDLNDRLAFTKHLFDNSPEDYNRVLNQLTTFDTYGETKQFIEDMVKPDYNNWQGKDDYAHRFMEILERKFL